MSEKVLQQILSKLDTVANNITDLKSESKEIKESVSRIELKQDIIYLQTGKLSEYHTAITSQLTGIEDRLAFQTHKLTETELELFKLKRN